MNNDCIDIILDSIKFINLAFSVFSIPIMIELNLDFLPVLVEC